MKPRFLLTTWRVGMRIFSGIALLFLTCISLTRTRVCHANKKAKKIYLSDPFIFHSLKWWAFGGKWPFSKALVFLKDAEEKSKLIESVVCNHLIRLLFSMEPSVQFDYIKVVLLGKWQKERGGFCDKLERWLLYDRNLAEASKSGFKQAR